jgi:hypothetical protein
MAMIRFREATSSTPAEDRRLDQFHSALLYLTTTSGAVPDEFRAPARELIALDSCVIADKARAERFIYWLRTLAGWRVGARWQPVKWKLIHD